MEVISPGRVDAEHPARKARWSTDAMTSETHGRFKRWFWRPPRAHGETIADRQVSVLELFYDLVYVAVIGQAAHHLAEHVAVRGLAEAADGSGRGFAATAPAGTS